MRINSISNYYAVPRAINFKGNTDENQGLTPALREIFADSKVPAYKKKKVVTPKRTEELMILEGEDNDAYMSLMTGFQMKTTAVYDANGNPVPIVPKHVVLIERTSKKAKKK